MPVNNKNVLVAPVNLEEVYDYMGVTSSNGIIDDVAICTCDRINKWAKYKPIRYPKHQELTESERAGSIQDKMNGIFYGLKLSCVSGQVEDMHSVTFDYYGVREGEDWSRLSDFDGYDKNARPNPVGALPEVIFVDLNQPHGECYVSYDTSNTTGVNVSDAIKAMTSTDLDLGDYYPCVLVTLDNHKYVRALWNLQFNLELRYEPSQNNDGFTTFRHNGAWWNRWAMIMQGLPSATDGKELTATIFFTRQITSGNGTMMTMDWREWKEISNAIFVNNGYACPDAIAKKILLKRFHSKGLDVAGGSWKRKLGSAATIIVNLLTEWVEPRADVTYTLKGILFVENYEDSIGSFNRDYVYNPEILFADMFEVDTTYIDMPTTTNIRLVWEVISSANPTTPCNSGETTLQYNDQSIN